MSFRIADDNKAGFVRNDVFHQTVVTEVNDGRGARVIKRELKFILFLS